MVFNSKVVPVFMSQMTNISGLSTVSNMANLTCDMFSIRYYCPAKTEYAEQMPCPPGTYNPDQGSTNKTACLACKEGHYCEKRGITSTKQNV